MIETNNLGFSCGPKTILENFDLSIDSGETVMLTGPNGTSWPSGCCNS